MTGKELIIYILSNDLEGKSMTEILSTCIIPIENYAAKKNTGVATVKVWIDLELIDSITIKDQIYILDIPNKN